MKQDEFNKRVLTLHNYIQSTNKRLKRIYKFSWKRIDVFWQEVWQTLLENPDQVVEDIVSEKLKTL